MIRPAATRAGVEEHVRGLDITVHKPAAVRSVERGGDLGNDLRGAAGWRLPELTNQ